MGFRSGLLKKLDTKKGGFQDVTSVLRLTLEKCRKRRRDTPYTERIEVFFILILIFSCATEYNTRLLGMFTSMLYRFIVAGLREQFHGQIWKMATFTLLSSLYQSSKTYCVGCLNRLLRACLTDTLHDRYFEKSSFYRVNRMLDNPDQRIASDVSEFCTTFISFMDKFLLSPILIAQYTYDTYNVDGFKGVVLVYLFFSVGVIIQRLFTPAMTRYSHAAVRTESESIFLSKTGSMFRRDVEYSFSDVISHIPNLLSVQFFMNVFANFFAYMGGALNYMILFYLIKSKSMTPAETSEFINRGSFVTLYLINKLSNFVTIGNHYSGMCAYAFRISEFCRVADEYDYVRQWDTVQEGDGSSPAIIFSGLDIVSPDEQCHIRDFDLRIQKGQNVYITGPNGSGKTSLVRVLMRLWRPARGRVSVVGNGTVSCAPQEATVYSGTLLEQLGLKNDHSFNEDACKALMAVKLGSLSGRAGGMTTFLPRSRWSEMLSPGEVQRLVLARILLESPTFAILDEATSAIDVSTERHIYEECWNRGITTITIGHRMDPTLTERIAIVVTLDGQGGHVIQRKGEEMVFDSSGRRACRTTC